MFVLDGVELVCPVRRGELDIVHGNELFGAREVLEGRDSRDLCYLLSWVCGGYLRVSLF